MTIKNYSACSKYTRTHTQQISIFMTHITNYATERLAPQLFTALFQFTHTWTNLELSTDLPLSLGKRYFEIFPEDKVPLWGVRML